MQAGFGEDDSKAHNKVCTMLGNFVQNLSFLNAKV